MASNAFSISIISIHLCFSTGKSGNKNQNNFQQDKTPEAIQNTPLRTQKSLPSLTPTPPLSNNLLSNVQPDQLKQLALMLLLKKQSNTLPTQSSPKLSYKITSEPIVHDVLIPTTVFKTVEITFGNKAVPTVLTSEATVTTQFTTFVTKTVPVAPVQPTLSPLLGGLGFQNQVNPLLLLLLG